MYIRIFNSIAGVEVGSCEILRNGKVLKVKDEEISKRGFRFEEFTSPLFKKKLYRLQSSTNYSFIMEKPVYQKGITNPENHLFNWKEAWKTSDYFLQFEEDMIKEIMKMEKFLLLDRFKIYEEDFDKELTYSVKRTRNFLIKLLDKKIRPSNLKDYAELISDFMLTINNRVKDNSYTYSSLSHHHFLSDPKNSEKKILLMEIMIIAKLVIIERFEDIDSIEVKSKLADLISEELKSRLPNGELSKSLEYVLTLQRGIFSCYNWGWPDEFVLYRPFFIIQSFLNKPFIGSCHSNNLLLVNEERVQFYRNENINHVYRQESEKMLEHRELCLVMQTSLRVDYAFAAEKFLHYVLVHKAKNALEYKKVSINKLKNKRGEIKEDNIIISERSSELFLSFLNSNLLNKCYEIRVGRLKAINEVFDTFARKNLELSNIPMRMLKSKFDLLELNKSLKDFFLNNEKNIFNGLLEDMQLVCCSSPTGKIAYHFKFKEEVLFPITINRLGSSKTEFLNSEEREKFRGRWYNGDVVIKLADDMGRIEDVYVGINGKSLRNFINVFDSEFTFYPSSGGSSFTLYRMCKGDLKNLVDVMSTLTNVNFGSPVRGTYNSFTYNFGIKC